VGGSPGAVRGDLARRVVRAAKAVPRVIASGKRAKNHKLIIITAGDTLKNTKAFVKKLKHAAVREKFPKSYRGFTRRERNSRVLFIRSHFSHMGLVVSGKVIPLILRITPLRRL